MAVQDKIKLAKNYETSNRLYMDRTVYIDQIDTVDDLQDGECGREREVDYYKVEDVKVLYVQRRADRLYAICEDGVDRCVSGDGPYSLKRFYYRKLR